MYNELLSEADSFKALEKNIVNMDEDIKGSNSKLVSKSKLLMLSKRRFENLEHVNLHPTLPLTDIENGTTAGKHGLEPCVHPGAYEASSGTDGPHFVY